MIKLWPITWKLFLYYVIVLVWQHQFCTILDHLIMDFFHAMFLFPLCSHSCSFKLAFIVYNRSLFMNSIRSRYFNEFFPPLIGSLTNRICRVFRRVESLTVVPCKFSTRKQISLKVYLNCIWISMTRNVISEINHG